MSTETQHPNNAQRGEWAREVLDKFARRTWGAPLTEQHPENLEYILCDLLCDLMHYADGAGIDFATAYERSAGHHDHERTYPED
jgi:hypothetical protein